MVWEAIKGVFTTVFEVIKTIVTTYFNIYKTIIQTVLTVIQTVITTVGERAQHDKDSTRSSSSGISGGCG